MTVMLDIIGATILVGMLMFTIFTVNTNLTLESYSSLQTYQIHTEMIQIARIIEFDMYKTGYRVSGIPKIIAAKESQFIFRADLFDNGTVNVVEYVLGDFNNSSKNPRDRSLKRIVNSQALIISDNVTDFRLFYYDSLNNVLPTPVSNLNQIKAVRVFLIIETSNPTGGYGTVDTTDDYYTGAYYEKLIYPKNL